MYCRSPISPYRQIPSAIPRWTLYIQMVADSRCDIKQARWLRRILLPRKSCHFIGQGGFILFSSSSIKLKTFRPIFSFWCRFYTSGRVISGQIFHLLVVNSSDCEFFASSFLCPSTFAVSCLVNLPLMSQASTRCIGTVWHVWPIFSLSSGVPGVLFCVAPIYVPDYGRRGKMFACNQCHACFGCAASHNFIPCKILAQFNSLWSYVVRAVFGSFSRTG